MELVYLNIAFILFWVFIYWLDKKYGITENEEETMNRRKRKAHRKRLQDIAKCEQILNEHYHPYAGIRRGFFTDSTMLWWWDEPKEAEMDKELNHFWYSQEQARTSHGNTIVIDGIRTAYTECTSSYDYTSKFDDVSYLGCTTGFPGFQYNDPDFHKYTPQARMARVRASFTQDSNDWDLRDHNKRMMAIIEAERNRESAVWKIFKEKKMVKCVDCFYYACVQKTLLYPRRCINGVDLGITSNHYILRNCIYFNNEHLKEKKMEKDQPTKDNVLRTYRDATCDETRNAIKGLWPKYFEDEWVDVSREVKAKMTFNHSTEPDYDFFRLWLYHDGTHIITVHHADSATPGFYQIPGTKGRYKIEISNISRTGMRILKKR